MAKIGRQGDGGGQPPVVFDKERIAKVEALAACLTVEQIADYFGISHNTFTRVRERQPEVLEAYKRGRSKAIANVSSNLIIQAQNGNTTAAMFYLKTQAGWKETSVQEEHVSINTGKIVAYIPDNGRLKDDGNEETN